MSNAFKSNYPAGCDEHNFDLAKPRTDPLDPSTGCGADGKITLGDILAVLDSFAGHDTCGCGGVPPSPPPPPPAPPCEASQDPIIILDPTPLYAAAHQPPAAYLVDVHVYGFRYLRGYEVGIEATGPNAGDIQLTSVTIDDLKPTYVFVTTPSSERIDAFDSANGRMAGALHKGGVKVRSYLGTFKFDPAPGAPSSFSVTVQTTTETAIYDPGGCDEYPPMYDVELDF